MEKTAKSLNVEEAIRFLPEDNWVHVFDQNVQDEGVQWPRKKVVEWFEKNGVEFSGDEARKANHGLCSPDGQGGWLFFQTRARW